jgi:hypothetical protein
MSSVRIKPEEQFARLLELSSPVSTGVDPAMGSMATLAGALRAAGQSSMLPTPDPAFRDALRQRLVAVATVQADLPVTTRVRERGLGSISYRMQRRVAGLTGAVAIATSFAGVGVAAAHSLPGDPFYGVKRATESVQLWTARGDEAKGKKHLEFAATRLAEARSLPANSSHLASTLSAMDAETTAGSNELITAYKSSHSTAPLADLVTFTNSQVTGLTKLAVTLPVDLKAKEAASLNLLGGVAGQVKKVANGVCILCNPNGVTPTKTKRPSPKPSSHPSQHPSNTPSAHPHSSGPSTRVSAHPSQGAGGHNTGSPAPTKGSILPTPSSILSSILHPKHTHTPIPIVSTLLHKLGLGG